MKEKQSNMSLLSKIGYLFLGFIAITALLIPILSPIDPNVFNPNTIPIAIAPSWPHILGTDDLGRDILLRCLFGARISLLVGFVSMGISLSIGLVYGIISGYMGGWIDECLMRFIDLFMAIPTLFLILIIQVLISPSIWNVVIVIGLTSWMGMARLVRAEVLSIKERPFILAAKARSIPTLTLLSKHILPHTLSPILVATILGIGDAILIESVLSFLGLGVQPPQASWGNMLENSLSYMNDAPWMALMPGLFITATVLSLNFIGDHLRSYLSPQ